MRYLKIFAVAALLAGVVIGPASADVISFSASTVPATTTTNFTNLSAFTISKFDTSQGTLTSIDVSLSGNVAGTIKYENLDNTSANLTLTLSALLQLLRPDTTTILSTSPSVTQNVTPAAAFDGDNNFGGTSGGVYNDLLGSLNNTISLTSGSDLALFSGTGNIILGLSGSGTSNGSGAGNLVTQFNTQAGGDLEITYHYNTPTVPEPASMALLGTGLLGLGAMLRRRRRG